MHWINLGGLTIQIKYRVSIKTIFSLFLLISQPPTKEEKLETVRLRKMEWATTAMMRKIALEIINKAGKKAESGHYEEVGLEAGERA